MQTLTIVLSVLITLFAIGAINQLYNNNIAAAITLFVVCICYISLLCYIIYSDKKAVK